MDDIQEPLITEPPPSIPLPTYTATIIYSYIWTINAARWELSTYTHTYTNTAGEHTAWPIITHAGRRADQQREVLAIPLTLTSPGGLWTLEGLATEATRSPTRETLDMGLGNVPPQPTAGFDPMLAAMDEGRPSLFGVSKLEAARYGAVGLFVGICLAIYLYRIRQRTAALRGNARSPIRYFDDSKSMRMQA